MALNVPRDNLGQDKCDCITRASNGIIANAGRRSGCRTSAVSTSNTAAGVVVHPRGTHHMRDWAGETDSIMTTRRLKK